VIERKTNVGYLNKNMQESTNVMKTKTGKSPVREEFGQKWGIKFSEFYET